MRPANARATSDKVVPLRPAAPSRRQVRLDAIDRQFLPGVLELLETPPSPIHVRLMLAICALFTATLAWSWFGRIDIHAVATGRVQPVGRTKLVQPMETGRIKRVTVENGSHVEAGDLLAELDSTEIQAERDSVRADLMGTEAEIIRRQAALRAAAATPIAVPDTLTFPGTVSDPAVRVREEAVLRADLAQLAARLESLTTGIAEKRATLARLESGIEARGRVLATLQERLDMRRTLVDRGAGTRADVVVALHDFEQARTNLVADQGQVGETHAAIASLEQKAREAISHFVAENTGKLAEAARRRSDLQQSLVKATARVERTRLYAPVTGTIQELAVTTPGQVVTGGQQLMSVVPNGADLEIEAMVVNADIGFLEPGQSAVLKIDAFPFTRYGTLPGRVTRVSTDAVDARQAALRPGANTGTNAAAQDGARATQPTQGLVFPITVEPDQAFMRIDGKRIPLTPGMEVTVEVRTGERRILEYLLSPLIEIASSAMRER
ncbi:HlyD family type I secretion periplasmic adaptor subunit [Methylobacterium sp. NPDC080182]|uniref:HlyD family type I secretion periplasmic adaptor subunit n=1 Tax=Methylobacterium sp. NPDC080182 TaxID=3390590 RepID=UPI003D072BB8